MGPRGDPHEFGEKKSHRARLGSLFEYSNVTLSQELHDAQSQRSRCIVVVKQPRFVLPQFSSLLARWAKYTQQDLLVDLQSIVGFYGKNSR